MTEKKTESMELDTDKIVVSKTNPRADFDKESLKELAFSIGWAGVLQPLIVRKKGKKYVLVAGERRLRAAKMEGLKTVPVIVKELDDAEALAVQMAENKDREDLSPLEEALGYTQLQEEGWTQEQIGERFGESQEQVSNRVRLLNLPKGLHKDISRGIITPGHAKELLRLKRKRDQLEVAKRLTRWDRRPSVKQTKEVVDKTLRHTERREEFEKVYKDAKVKKCPKCGKKAIQLDDDFRKPVLTCCEYYVRAGHRWRPDTGEVVFTKREREEEEERKRRAKEKAAERKERLAGEAHVPTMPAWIFSMASKEEWVKALVDHVAENIGIMAYSQRDLYESRTYGSQVLVLQFDGGDIAEERLTLRPIEFLDADRHFKTRITIGEYRSTPSNQDNVARGKEEVAKVKETIKKLMKFQREKVGVPQKTNECMIREFDGFKLGGKVKVASEFTTKSYRGMGAEVVGFYENGHAVLNYSKPRKTIHIEDLEAVD
jgi:ParB family chromosome partitioning protein